MVLDLIVKTEMPWRKSDFNPVQTTCVGFYLFIYFLIYKKDLKTDFCCLAYSLPKSKCLVFFYPLHIRHSNDNSNHISQKTKIF